ncbi:MAG: DivIVA domain-containing protein [Longimicrobiales bacterium]|nr:DivIVA domain-containing protein [Longimicrobiales bacterium]
MIDLTPLDVRKKRGDFARALRGYEVQHVDGFLELVAERLEEVVKENLTLTERVARLSEQVDAQSGRERAVNDALVTAQQLREEIGRAAERESDVIRRQAQAEAERLVADARARVAELERELHEFERRRSRFLATFRQFLERELDTIEVQEGRGMEGERAVDLDLGVSRRAPDPGTEPGSGIEPSDAALHGAAAGPTSGHLDPQPLGVFDPVEDLPSPPHRSRRAEGAEGEDEGERPGGEVDPELGLPRPDADVHRLAADPDLSTDPGEAPLRWVDPRDDDER